MQGLQTPKKNQQTRHRKHDARTNDVPESTLISPVCADLFPICVAIPHILVHHYCDECHSMSKRNTQQKGNAISEKTDQNPPWQ
eukprot:6641575-Karenia_brevis.AAC.1